MQKMQVRTVAELIRAADTLHKNVTGAA